MQSDETGPQQLLLSVKGHDGTEKEPDGRWGAGGCWNKCLFLAGQSGAQTFRLIVSCHCQHKTKACDLSMCSVTALKTDAKPQGSGPATLFQGSVDGMGWGRGSPPEAARVGGREGQAGGRSPLQGREVALLS